MFINQACFESEKINEGKLIEKAKNTLSQTKGANGLIAAECWKRDKKELVEYAIVTKWHTKSDFIAWLSREEHVNEHKEMHKRKKQGVSEAPLFKKTLFQYETMEPSDS